MKPSSKNIKDLLDLYSHTADAISTLFFPYAEVVIHDLEKQKVIYIANNLSKRSIGDDSALDEIQYDSESMVIGPYEKLNWDGRKLRSISVVLGSKDHGRTGMMCINFNIAFMEEIRAVLDIFIKGAGIVSQPNELFKDDWQERINKFLHSWLEKNQVALNSLSREHKRDLVSSLYNEGAFNGKSSVNYVANVLGLGRATVYKYIKMLSNE